MSVLVHLEVPALQWRVSGLRAVQERSALTMVSLRENDLPQISQLYGLSLLWLRRWRLRWSYWVRARLSRDGHRGCARTHL
jgi:hypothetical protein